MKSGNITAPLCPDVPKAKGISDRNIISAFVRRSRYQKRRIKAYGQINRDVLKELGAEIVTKFK
jgi:hypothetical protein